MQIRCPKCKTGYDPETESSYCGKYFGHAPIVKTEQNITDALTKTIEKKKPAPQFQSDFKLIWNEPGNS